MGDVVVVIGAAGPIGRQVVHAAAADPQVSRVVAVDRHAFALPRPHDLPATVERCVGPGALTEAAEALGAATTIVHLAPSTAGDPGPDGTACASATPDSLADVLGAASGRPQLIVLSSATVYGATAANPVPLTEASPLRPGPDSPFATSRQAIEQRARRWSDEIGGAPVCILRTCLVGAHESRRWFASSPWVAAARDGEGRGPLQLVHVDDLAAAIDVARRRRLRGEFNVAPSGWITPDGLAALTGPIGRVRQRTRRFRRRQESLGPAYLEHPWVVASDRLLQQGWTPAHTSEEVFVETDAAGAVTDLNAKRRQQLSLAASGLVLGAAVGGTVVVLRRRARGRPG